MKNNKKIYIILTHTGTVFSKVIKCYTGAKFSHVSLSLDEDLEHMYSFGRLNPYNPFIGGFVQEGINIGTFKRFKNTEAEIYSFTLSSKQYKKLKSVIKRIKRKSFLYKYNVLGVLTAAFNIKFKRNNYFYCSEFVRYLIYESKLNLELPELTKPCDFQNLKELQLVYSGTLRDYILK